MVKTVRVSESLEPIFEQAEGFVANHFSTFRRSPEEGTIHVGDERYVLVRAKSLSLGLFNIMRDTMGAEEALKFWYRMARMLGEEDSRAFCAARNIEDDMARVSTGPIHFAYTGWARVEIDDRSSPTNDDNHYVEYTHPNTFEAESFLSAGQAAEKPVCVFSAGYSAGWASEAFRLELHAREVTCIAAGGTECRFVMGAWNKLDEFANAVLARNRACAKE